MNILDFLYKLLHLHKKLRLFIKNGDVFMIHLFSANCKVLLESSKLKMVNGEWYIFIFIFLSIYYSPFTINPSLVKDHDFMPCALHLQQPRFVNNPG